MQTMTFKEKCLKKMFKMFKHTGADRCTIGYE